MIETSGYLIIQPARRGRDGAVVGIELDRIVKTKPTRLGVRDVAVKLTLRVDERLFLPIEPEIVVELRDARQIVEVEGTIPAEAEEASDGDGAEA